MMCRVATMICTDAMWQWIIIYVAKHYILCRYPCEHYNATVCRGTIRIATQQPNQIAFS